jgi:thiol-disulfide isomerase/thioredoxin
MHLFSRRAFLASISGAGIASTLAGQDARERAPSFWAKTLDGDRYTNDTVKGKVLLVQFWTTWCPYCRRDQPSVETISDEFKDKGLIVLAVDVGEPKKKVRKYLDDSPRSCKIVLMEDTNLAAIFATKVYPVYVLIDRDGSLAGRQNGAGGENGLRRLLAKAGVVAE